MLATGVRFEMLVPKYTASTGGDPEAVEATVSAPRTGAVHEYQTERPVALPA